MDERRRSREEEESRTTLMDSLDLDHPHLSRNTLPNIGRTPMSNPNQKYNSLVRSKKGKGSGLPRKGNLEFDHDVIFGLDKRASVRSDPGDREQGGGGAKSKLSQFRSLMGGSSHTSPTSSSAIVSEDTTHPINIPNHAHSNDSEVYGSPVHRFSSDSSSSGGKLVNVKHPSVQNKVVGSGKGRGTISKGNISLPTGPLYKEVPQAFKKVKVVGVFRFEYTGGDGEGEGYYREVETEVAVSVNPGLLFEQFDITTCEK